MSPSPFVMERALACLATRDGERRRALDVLDVAMGRGRHALPLARAGFRVFGVDNNLAALCDAAAAARREQRSLALWCADLMRHTLPRGRFDLIVVTRYLQRDLFQAIQEAVVPGGVVIYETFTIHQRQHGAGPTSPEHLLEPGELRQVFSTFEEVFYEESMAPEAVARIVARRPN